MVPMIVVTGGAGYVGHHLMRLLGKGAIAIDDLRNSHRAALGPLPLLEGDIASVKPDWSQVEAVYHLAGSISPAESMVNPALYWKNNVAAAIEFFQHAEGKSVVFSSTCAVYGEPRILPVREDYQKKPISVYGKTKLLCENLLRDLGVRLSALRYFNAAGGAEDHKDEIHLIPRVIRAAMTGETLEVYGDGSATRDYVHVEDIALAHLKALDNPGEYNIGSGKGTTILDIIKTAERVIGRKVKTKFLPARLGDPKVLIADVRKARKELGWQPRHTLEQIIDSTYQWRKQYPNGYAGEVLR